MTAVVDAGVWVAAADPDDLAHERSRAFLRAVTEDGVALVVPAHALVELACALARRFADAARGAALARAMLDAPQLAVEPLTQTLLDEALDVGTRLFLRSGDAFYAAVSQRSGWQLISWDRNLIERAGALTPDAWLAVAREGRSMTG